jgi:predicted RNA binding protein YcfA (HicA-like mRNA interferase family)
MPQKVRELIAQLENAGFVNKGGKGSHRKFVHPDVALPIVISGKPGSDARKYQERAVAQALKEVRKK